MSFGGVVCLVAVAVVDVERDVAARRTGRSSGTCEHAPAREYVARGSELVPAPGANRTAFYPPPAAQAFLSPLGGDHPPDRCPTRPRRHGAGWRQRERRVLERDGYRCTYCGDLPPASTTSTPSPAAAPTTHPTSPRAASATTTASATAPNTSTERARSSAFRRVTGTGGNSDGDSQRHHPNRPRKTVKNSEARTALPEALAGMDRGAISGLGDRRAARSSSLFSIVARARWRALFTEATVVTGIAHLVTYRSDTLDLGSAWGVQSQPDRIYRHFCMTARALEVIGERWSLLVVRDLLPVRAGSPISPAASPDHPDPADRPAPPARSGGVDRRASRPRRGREVWYRLTDAGRHSGRRSTSSPSGESSTPRSLREPMSPSTAKRR